MLYTHTVRFSHCCVVSVREPNHNCYNCYAIRLHGETVRKISVAKNKRKCTYPDGELRQTKKKKNINIKFTTEQLCQESVLLREDEQILIVGHNTERDIARSC